MPSDDWFSDELVRVTRERDRLQGFAEWVLEFTKHEPPFSGGRQVHDRASEALADAEYDEADGHA